MKLPTSNLKLRKALDLERLDAIDHKLKVAALRSVWSHSIAYDGQHTEETCVPYALDLTNDETYEAVRRAFRLIYAGPEFFQWLLDNGYLRATSAVKGCLACYFADGIFKHVGIKLSQDRVISKWGEMPRYRHGLAEVPLAYGMDVHFFDKPVPNKARRLFREFAVSKGLREDEIQRAIEKYRRR
jgi:hypothetical protein